MTKGKHSRLLESADAAIAAAMEPGEDPVVYTFCFEAIADEVAVVTNRRLIIAGGKGIKRTVPLSAIRATRLGRQQNGTYTVSVDSGHGLLMFLDENAAQALCAAIDQQLTS